MTAVLLLALLELSGSVADLTAVLDRYAKQPYEQSRREAAIRALGRIGSPAATRALEGLLDDPFAHLRDAAVSALIQLKRQPPAAREPSLKLLGGFLRRRSNPETRRHIATALGLIKDRAALPPLVAALGKERDPETVAAIAAALARLSDVRAVDALERKARRFAAGRAACLRALAGFAYSGEFALGFRNDPLDDVRAAVVDVLARRRMALLPDLKIDTGIGERLGIALADALPVTSGAGLVRRRAAGLLQHPSWRVRAAAIEAVRRCRDPALIEDLVACLARERGRLRADAWNALRALTGKEIPPDPAQWRALIPVARLAPGGQQSAPRIPGRTRAYFGLPLFSRRIAFLFDASGSMRDDGKIEKARKEFALAAAKLGPEQRYDLFIYRYRLDYPPRPALERAFGKLVAGKPKRAAAWLAKQPAKGAGAIYDGLLAAMDDPEVDTIYLLSDGVPSFGSVSRDYRILQEIERHNRWRRVTIHTILLGTKGTDRRFMRRLAEITGGVAVDAEGRSLR